MTNQHIPMLAEFAAIDRYLNAAMEVMHQGHMPDMAGLDARIAHLCASVESSDSDAQQVCLPKLHAILKKIDMCEQAIRDLNATQTALHIKDKQ